MENDEATNTEIGELLRAARDGDSDAVRKLVPILHDELYGLARVQRSRWGGRPTLSTTSILHEAYVKIAAQPSPDWRERSHFMAVACTAMRQVLIDHARQRQAQKRGGGIPNVTFDEIESMLASGERTDAEDEALLVLNEALHRLAEQSPRQARVVECRFFGGLTIPETGEALGISHATVSRDWAMAQTWLYRELCGS